MQYTIRQNIRAKHIRITVRPDGTVVVTKPRRVSLEMVHRFVEIKKDWILSAIHRRKPHIKHSKNEIEELKQKAKIIAEEKVKQFNQYYKFTYNKISIRNQTTRWGSCSKKGNLNFNYKIALLPEKLADYLVVHEICHLGEFNHSQKFWDLVGEMIPDYIILQKELKNQT